MEINETCFNRRGILESNINFKMDIKIRGCEDVDWIHLATIQSVAVC
jgi:hypothetical protein